MFFGYLYSWKSQKSFSLPATAANYARPLKSLEKYYIVDIGLRSLLLGNRGRDVGHVLENIVYLELRRRGYEVYIGKIDELEVDFVARGPKGIQYIQVAASVRDETTLARELAGSGVGLGLLNHERHIRATLELVYNKRVWSIGHTPFCPHSILFEKW